MNKQLRVTIRLNRPSTQNLLHVASVKFTICSSYFKGAWPYEAETDVAHAQATPFVQFDMETHYRT